MIDENPLMPEVVAKMLSLSEKQLANLRSQGRGPPYIKVGALVRYPASELKAWIEAGGDAAVERAKAVKLSPVAEQPATVDHATAAPTARERALLLGRKLSGDAPPTPETLASRPYALGLRLRDNQP